MDKKPELIVKLFAGDTLIDQSADAGLWQRVLSEIRGIAAAPPVALSPLEPPDAGGGYSKTPISAFAKSIGVTPEQLVGSLDPTAAAPFIHLNSHDWEALKRNTPLKGPGSVGPSVLAATALVLWQKHCNEIGDITLQTVRGTIGTIDLQDQNAGRSIGNCDWLQSKANRITLNPSRSSAATRLVTAYCLREPIAEAR